MNAVPFIEKSLTLTLPPMRAEELMTANPLSVRAAVSAEEAATFLTERRISAAPVIDEAGRPIGVVSKSDLLIHRAKGGPETVASDLMTPAVFTAPRDAPAAGVVRDMVRLKVHRLFVVDEFGVLIGVISALDILRRLSGGR
jgi:predicted transcriptional regulator